MPIASGALRAVAQASAARGGISETTTKRVRKADRGFSPDGLGLRPCSVRIAEQLNLHFQRVREGDDVAYADRWYEFLRREQRERLLQAGKMAEWYKSKRGTPMKPRVQASKLKECGRQQWFKMSGFPKTEQVGKDSPHWCISALVGEELHFMVETALKFLGLARRAEFRVYSADNTLGGIVDVELEGHPVILDIKSVGPDDFKEGAWGSKVPGYMAQISVYGRLTDNTRGIILLADRGSGKFLDLEFDIDPGYADELLGRATELVRKVNDREMPAPEGFQNGRPVFTCHKFCPFFRLCLLNEETREAEGGVVERWLAQGATPEEIVQAVRAQESPTTAQPEDAGPTVEPLSE
jgi:hypothetical protein